MKEIILRNWVPRGTEKLWEQIANDVTLENILNSFRKMYYFFIDSYWGMAHTGGDNIWIMRTYYLFYRV